MVTPKASRPSARLAWVVGFAIVAAAILGLTAAQNRVEPPAGPPTTEPEVTQLLDSLEQACIEEGECYRDEDGIVRRVDGYEPPPPDIEPYNRGDDRVEWDEGRG